jgi:threonine synthase
MSHGQDPERAAGTIALNRHATVVCLVCGNTAASDRPFWGCAACGVAAPLTINYPPGPQGNSDVRAAVAAARDAFAILANAAHDAAPHVATPLAAAPRLGPRVSLKHETFSLTGSHKDRYHAVAAAVARLLGSPGVVSSSTGNHGVSAAAHAAAHGLRAVIFCHAAAPPGLLRAIAAFGGVAVQLDAAAQRAALVALVEDGWFPATSLDPALNGAGNPFGAEGYKPVAYEIAEQLGDMPAAVFIPTAGGDTYFGIMKGFSELARLLGTPMPIGFAIQPEGANALSRSVAAGHPVAVADPQSIALSLSDRETGRHAIGVVDRWAGRVLDVSERAIRDALATLAGMGVYSDPASAAALAGYRRAVALGALSPDASAVLLLTSSGFKWPDAMAEVFPTRAMHSVDELQAHLSQLPMRTVVAG